jgi:23S rRNA (uridine2552-2'-O)-methyltransferase
VRVNTARGRKISSTRWLSRQLNDPYVVQARKAGYRSRAAFKLTELDDRFGFLRGGAQVVDLGAAPGGWTQVAVERAGKDNVIAVDASPMDAIVGAQIITADIFEDASIEAILEVTRDGLDVVLSDIAPAATGHRSTDHLRIVALAEAAFDVACRILRPGGVFVAKVYQGGAERDLLAALKLAFRTVKHAKPNASRKESSETYVIAIDFRAADAETVPDVET